MSWENYRVVLPKNDGGNFRTVVTASSEAQAIREANQQFQWKFGYFPTMKPIEVQGVLSEKEYSHLAELRRAMIDVCIMLGIGTEMDLRSDIYPNQWTDISWLSRNIPMLLDDPAKIKKLNITAQWASEVISDLDKLIELERKVRGY